MKCLIGTTAGLIFAALIFSVLGSHQAAFAQTDTGAISGSGSI
jgi:uncharacterized membrane protein YgaE (UPF0421/DUF939 family)